MSLSIGVDIGGTKVLAAVVDGVGRVLDTEATATPGPGSGIEKATVQEVEDALVEVVQRLIAQYGRLTVGVAAAGFVARDGDRVRFAPHLPWRDEPLAERLGKRLRQADPSAGSWSTTTPLPRCGRRRASAPPRRPPTP